MAMEILYKVHRNLYVNLTNRCSCACTFCLRQDRDSMGSSGSLWLDHEPTAEEVMEEFAKFRREDYEEVVFCGFGEPTEAFEVLKEVAAFVKREWKCPIRINTNGQGSLINGRDIAPELEGLIDTVSISLNNPDPEKYQEIVRSRFGTEGYAGMLAFAKECTKYVPHVVMTTVDTTITKEEEERCRKICEELGVTYRIREWEAQDAALAEKSVEP